MDATRPPTLQPHKNSSHLLHHHLNHPQTCRMPHRPFFRSLCHRSNRLTTKWTTRQLSNHHRRHLTEAPTQQPLTLKLSLSTNLLLRTTSSALWMSQLTWRWLATPHLRSHHFQDLHSEPLGVKLLKDSIRIPQASIGNPNGCIWKDRCQEYQGHLPQSCHLLHWQLVTITR